MRIDRLDLTAFGPFTAAALDLSRGAEGLHLVYGPNEAGKSSALRAIKQFFAGIPVQSTDNFIHEHKLMRIGVRLRTRAGAVHELVRRKGTKNTLIGPDDAPRDDGLLAVLLGGVPIDEFLHKFVIDRDELVAGGRSVVEGRGDLGQALFSAASGIAGLGAVRKELDADAEALYKPQASKPIINAQLAELKVAAERKKTATLRSTVWLDHVEARDLAQAKKESLERALDDDRRDRPKLQRLAQALVPAARRAAVLIELSDLADAPRLRTTFGFERRDALSILGPNERQEDELQQSIAESTAWLEADHVPEVLLARAEDVETLHLRLGGRRQSALDRGRRETERLGLEAEVRAALKSIAHDPALLDLGLDSPTLEALRPATADRAAVQELALARPTLDQAVAQSNKDIRKHDAQRASAVDKLAALGPARDPSELNKAKARAPVDIDDRRRDNRAALAKRARRADVALAALGLWSGPLDALEALPVPPPETLERCRAEFDAALLETTDLRRQIDALDADARQTVARLEGLRLAGDIPNEDALTAARAARDALWRRLADAPAWENSVASDYVSAVRKADDLADRLRREAERVASLAGLRADQARQTSERHDISNRFDRAAAALDALSARWSALWSPLGVLQPGTPAEMLAWLRRQSKLAEDARTLRDDRDDLAALDDQSDALRRALAAGFAALGEPLPAERETLADLLERAEEAVDAERKHANDRKKHADKIKELDGDRPALESALADALAARESWQSRWAGATNRIGLEPTISPNVADAMLAETVRLFDRLDQARALRRALDEADREADQFAGDVRALAARVAPDLLSPTADPEVIARELNDRLVAARERRYIHDDRSLQLTRKQEAARAARAAVAENRRKLDALCLEAGGAAPEELPAIEERAALRHDRETELARLDDALRPLAAGTPLDDFLALAAAADLDDLSAKIANLDESIKSQLQERDSLIATIAEKTEQLKRMDGNADAADAGQDAEGLRARIKEDVAQYARFRLASAVLKAGIERYRQKAEGPVLARASAHFAAFTLGSFEALKVDFGDRDEPVLKGARPGGRESLGVSALSEGAADQLYLALRLAALEADLDHREPLPLVVDDVLIQFDDGRAAATLAALAALSKRTQVLIFTHHRHLLDLARDVVPPADLLCHTLASSGMID